MGLLVWYDKFKFYFLDRKEGITMENDVRRGIRKDWGMGLPKYTEDDLMTKAEIHDFALEIVFNYITEGGYEIQHFNKTYGRNPSFICKRDGEEQALMVKSDIAPNHPKLDTSEKKLFIEFCSKYNYKPIFCPVSFGAADQMRFEKSIALIGDAFYCNFTGFEIVELD